VYDIGKTKEFLLKQYPQYINWVEPKGLVLQSVPEDLISKIYFPKKKLKNLQKKTTSDVEKAVIKFVSLLSSESDIPLNNFGVSGSVLIDLEISLSDLDVIVYGEDAGLRVYKTLKRFRKSQDLIKPYNFHTVSNVVKNRWGNADIGPSKFTQIETQKVLHGLVDGKEYFIRLVKKPEEYSCEASSKPLGKVVIRAKIVDSTNSIFTPCTYIVDGCSFINPPFGPEIKELVSYRGKFTEQADVGDFVEASGRVEGVVFQGRTCYRLVMGNKNDYLISTRYLENNLYL